MSKDLELDPDAWIYTYNELVDYVNDQWESMSDDEKSSRMMNADPTFEEWVLYYLKPGNKVAILYTEYKIIYPKITLWYRLDSKSGEYVFNHIVDGWEKVDRDCPRPKSFSQEKFWNSAKWKKRFGYLNNYVVEEIPKEFEWTKYEVYRGN